MIPDEVIVPVLQSSLLPHSLEEKKTFEHFVLPSSYFTNLHNRQLQNLVIESQNWLINEEIVD